LGQQFFLDRTVKILLTEYEVNIPAGSRSRGCVRSKG